MVNSNGRERLPFSTSFRAENTGFLVFDDGLTNDGACASTGPQWYGPILEFVSSVLNYVFQDLQPRYLNIARLLVGPLTEFF
jgi:hypothetical protein